MLLKRVYKILYILQKEKKKKRYSGGGVGPSGIFAAPPLSTAAIFTLFFPPCVCIDGSGRVSVGVTGSA